MLFESKSRCGLTVVLRRVSPGRENCKGKASSTYRGSLRAGEFPNVFQLPNIVQKLHFFYQDALSGERVLMVDGIFLCFLR